MNDDFLTEHRTDGYQSCIKTLKYALILQGGCLSLWQPDESDWKLIEKKSILTVQYHEYKSLAHIPLKIQRNFKTGSVLGLNQSLNDLERLKKMVLISGDYQEYLAYINDCIGAIQAYITHPPDQHTVLSNLKTRTNKTVGILMKLATNQVLPNLKDTLENWLLQYDIQLKQLKTVVACTHGPKSKLIESQYLISIYKRELGAIDDSEVLNNYLYITEVLPSQLSDSTILEQQLIKELLVPSQVNREIGEDMLNSPIGMFQDILHEDGAEWVERDEKEYRRQNAYCPISNE